MASRGLGPRVAGLPLIFFFVGLWVPAVLVGAVGFHFIVCTEVMPFGLGVALCFGFAGGRLEPAVEMSVSGFQRAVNLWVIKPYDACAACNLPLSLEPAQLP